MSCDRYLELLSLRLDGPLTGKEERELEAHLSRCPDCRAAGAQLAALRFGFAEWEEVSAPEGFAQGVMDRIQAAEAPKVVPLFKRPQVRTLAGLAACLAVVVGLYGASRWKTQEKTMLMTRSFQQDVLWEETTDGADASACEALTGDESGPMVNAVLVDPESADAPQITAYAAPEDMGEMPLDARKAIPDSDADGLRDDWPLMEGTTTLERMPEGAAELIPPETVVTPMDGQQGSVYLNLPLEVLDQIERLAQEQGIGVTAERCSAPGAEVVYNLEILQ